MATAAEFREIVEGITAPESNERKSLAVYADYIQSLEAKIWLLERRTYGRSSEKYVDPNRVDLFNEAEVTAAEQPANDANADSDDADDVTEVSGHQRKKRRGQIEIPADMPRQVETHELAPDARRCSCCNEPMAEIGENVSEKVHIIPAKVVAKKDIYKKYASKTRPATRRLNRLRAYRP